MTKRDFDRQARLRWPKSLTADRFTRSDEQYAWASIDPDKYGGSPQEDHG
jgi:hypothetical protein